MRGRLCFLVLLLFIGVTFLVAHSAHAEVINDTNKGLYVTPLRQYFTVDAGKPQDGAVTIANFTDTPIDVVLSVEQFSVADYSYDYSFEAVHDNWITLEATNIQLKPGQNKRIAFTISTPASTAPGGHYFTVFATTTLQNGAVKSRVQTASVLYVTMNGALDTSNSIREATVPLISFGTTIPYQLDVQNTGNTHFFIFMNGQLEGLSAKPAEAGESHILLPDTTRAITGSIPAPLLPGMYKATYGYKTENGQLTQHSQYVIYLPPWSIAIPVGIFILFRFLRRHKKPYHAKTTGS